MVVVGHAALIFDAASLELDSGLFDLMFFFKTRIDTVSNSLHPIRVPLLEESYPKVAWVCHFWCFRTGWKE